MALPVLTEESYRRLRNTSSQQANLRQARMGNQAAKRRLIQFNYSGYYPDGVVKGCRLPSQAFGFDVDDAGEFERIAKMLMEKRGPAMESQGTGARRGTAGSEIKGAAAEGGDAGEGKGAEGAAGEGATLAERLGLLMLERSASQGGHAVFKREKGKTILENQVRIAKALDCELDTNAHDINRVYFSSTADKDELLFLSPELFNDQYGVSPGADVERVAEEARTLEDREKNGREELPEGAHGSNKHFKVGERRERRSWGERRSRSRGDRRWNRLERGPNGGHAPHLLVLLLLALPLHPLLLPLHPFLPLHPLPLHPLLLLPLPLLLLPLLLERITWGYRMR